MAPADADAVHARQGAPANPAIDDVPVAPAQIDGDIHDPHAGPVREVGDLSNLIRELDEALQQMTAERPMSPLSSCCTSLGSWDLQISVSQNRDDSCDHDEVDSGIMADDDVLIFCCGMFRSPTEACVCTTL